MPTYVLLMMILGGGALAVCGILTSCSEAIVGGAIIWALGFIFGMLPPGAPSGATVAADLETHYPVHVTHVHRTEVTFQVVNTAGLSVVDNCSATVANTPAV